MRGALLLAGGSDLPPAAAELFGELIGGVGSRVVTLRSQAKEAGEPGAPAPTGGGWTARLQNLVTVDSDDLPGFGVALADARAVWLPAATRRQTAAWLATDSVRAGVRSVLERGGVVAAAGGSAAALGAWWIGGRRAPGDVRVATHPGAGLLAGFVIEPNVLRGNRLGVVLETLDARPGHVGLGLDDGAAVLLRGRRVLALGDGYTTLCLAASAHRVARIDSLRSGAFADLVALRRAAVTRTLARSPGEPRGVPRVVKGTLVIVGGGEVPHPIAARFVTAAGGASAPIVVVPTAGGDPVRAPQRTMEMLRAAGARDVHWLHTRDRARADDPEFLAPLRDARGVWFTGGRQWRLVDAYAGTLAHDLFRGVLERGGAIGGTSAGASIQAGYLVRGHPLGNTEMCAEGYERGLGFLPGVAIDQHFGERHRFPDMTEVMRRYPLLLGLGIDESTAAIVRGTTLQVLGRGAVAVYDYRDQPPTEAGAPDHRRLFAGARYDLAQRQVIDR